MENNPQDKRKALENLSVMMYELIHDVFFKNYFGNTGRTIYLVRFWYDADLLDGVYLFVDSWGTYVPNPSGLTQEHCANLFGYYQAHKVEEANLRYFSKTFKSNILRHGTILKSSVVTLATFEKTCPVYLN